MKRILAWLMIVGLLISGCNRGGASGNVSGLVAESLAEGTGVRFNLKGLKATDLPTLKVVGVDGTDWSAKVDKPELVDGVVTAKLQGDKGIAKLAVDQLDYTWTLKDGKTVAGTHQYRDVRFPKMAWQVTKTDKLLVYHVKPLRDKDMEEWTDLLNKVNTWTGVKQEKPMGIYVFPDIGTLNDWARLGVTSTIAGQWRGDVERLVVYDTGNSVERKIVMVHELIHAVVPGELPLWLDEGIATYYEGRYAWSLQQEKNQRWQAMEGRLQWLSEEASKKPISPTIATHNAERPFDPYTVGVSFWLFVKKTKGEAGVNRLFTDGGKENGVKKTLEAMYGKDLPEVMNDWNAFLTSGEAPKLWQNP